MDIRAAEAAERILGAQPEWDKMAEMFLASPPFRAGLPVLVADGDTEASVRRLAEGIARLDGLPSVSVACVAEAAQYHDPKFMSDYLTPKRRKLLSGGFQPVTGPDSPIWRRMEGAFGAAGMPFPPAGMIH